MGALTVVNSAAVAAAIKEGLVHHRAGRLAEAEAIYRRALAAQPEHPNALHLLGVIAHKVESHELAVTFIGRAIAANSRVPDYHNNLGLALRAQSQLEEAVSAHVRALELKPNDAEFHNNLGVVLRDQDKLEEAVVAYHKALELRPDFPEAHYNLGVVLRDQGKLEEAVAAFRRALAFKPDYLRAEWGALLALPILYASEIEIDSHRARWERGINTLLDHLDLSTDIKVKHAEDAVASQTNFYLHYQGRNDLPLQRLYGSLLHRIATAAYPGFCQDLPKRHVPCGQRIRIGFISSYLRHHSVYKTRSGWIKKLDKERFEVHVFYTGTIFDWATEDIKRHADRFHYPIGPDRALIETIRAAALDVLVYLDIGMDPKMQLPAALRLAPIQCMGWVHPVTSGLPTIDYFLSSELMEPDDADAHYSERLVRLPNLGISYPFPDVPDVARSKTPRAGNDKHVVYLCSQSLFKLLPQFDALYARIATQVPNSRFWFIANRSAHVTKQFMERLGRAFSDLGISAEKHCVIHPRMDFAGFLALNAEADILLDSILWSGCNSTFEAIACGLPVVTLPGPMMRGRHSYAILKMMELKETITRDEDHYVEIAVRLGNNDGWRKSIADKVTETRSRVFNDETPIRALEDFFERVCRPPLAPPSWPDDMALVNPRNRHV